MHADLGLVESGTGIKDAAIIEMKVILSLKNQEYYAHKLRHRGECV